MLLRRKAEEPEIEKAPEGQDENSTTPVRSTRKSLRTSTELKEASQRKTLRARKGEHEVVQKGGQSKGQNSSKDHPKQAEPEELWNYTAVSKEELTCRGAEQCTATGRGRYHRCTAYKKQRNGSPRAQTFKTDRPGRMETDRVEGTDTNQASPELEHDDVEETVEPQQRSSGRERRKPRRFSIETAPTKEPDLLEKQRNRNT